MQVEKKILKQDLPLSRDYFRKIFVIGLLVLVTYSNAIFNDFAYDDNLYILKNRNLVSFANLPTIFAQPLVAEKPELYRPIMVATFLTDYQIARTLGFWNYASPLIKYRAAIFHLTNIIAHFLCCIILLILLGKIKLNERAALITVLLFAVHPVHVEDVTSLVGRAEILATLLFLLSCVQFLSHQPGRSIFSKPVFLSLSFYLLALMSKEMAVTLPLVLILLLASCGVLRKDWQKDKTTALRNVFHSLLPFGTIFLFYLIIRLNVIGTIGIPEKYLYFKQTPYPKILASMAAAFPVYLRLLVLPVHLNMDYNFPLTFFDGIKIPQPDSFLSLPAILGLGALVVLIVSQLYFWKKHPVISLGVFWFLITLFPVSNVIPFGDLMAERFLYLPSIGFCIVAGYVLHNVLLKFEKERRMTFVLKVLAVATLLLLGAMSFWRNFAWKDDVTLWTAEMKVDPGNKEVYYGLGAGYQIRAKEAERRANALSKKELFFKEQEFRGKFESNTDSAIAMYRLSIERTPEEHRSHVNFSSLILKHRPALVDEAIESLKKGIKLFPLNQKSIDSFYTLLGEAYVEKKDLDNAIKYLEISLKFKSRNLEALNNLGVLFAMKKDFETARKYWRKALEIEPENKEIFKQLEKLTKLGAL